MIRMEFFSKMAVGDDFNIPFSTESGRPYMTVTIVEEIGKVERRWTYLVVIKEIVL